MIFKNIKSTFNLYIPFLIGSLLLLNSCGSYPQENESKIEKKKITQQDVMGNWTITFPNSKEIKPLKIVIYGDGENLKGGDGSNFFDVELIDGNVIWRGFIFYDNKKQNVIFNGNVRGLQINGTLQIDEGKFKDRSLKFLAIK